MKTLLVAVTLIVIANAFSTDDIPAHMKERLDRYIAIKKQWEDKWSAMTLEEQNHYEVVLLARIDQLPQIEHQRIRNKIASLPEGVRMKLKEYLLRRFPEQNREETFDNDDDEMDHIIQSLPEMIRNRLSTIILSHFEEATSYNVEDQDEMAFPDIPEIVDLPDVNEATGYSSNMHEDIRTRLDSFLLKREDWKRKWEQLSDEKREAFEKYISERS